MINVLAKARMFGTDKIQYSNYAFFRGSQQLQIFLDNFGTIFSFMLKVV